MIQKLFNSEARSISAASLVLAVSYALSALLGLFRDRLLAGIFGAGSQLDVYYTAFTVPDFIALILIFGAISAAVVPIFSSHLLRSKGEAFAYLSRLLNVFLGGLIIICVVLMIFTPVLIRLIAPGFSPEKQALAVQLMRIMFLSPILLGASNVISGILQVFHRFLITALAPLLYNVGIITGIIFFVPRMGLPGLAWGVVLGAVLHLLVQIPALRMSGFRHQMSFQFKDPSIRKTIRLMVPRSLGLGAGQLNTIATTAIASTLAAGSIAVFNLAYNLSATFINAVAVSVSTAAFPSMSMAFLQEDHPAFIRKFLNIVKQIFFLTIPLSLMLLMLRVQIVRVFYGVGRFDWTDTRLTAACLGILAFNLTAQALILFLSKSFYAAHNTRIPAVISGATVAFNIILSFTLVGLLHSSGWLTGVVQYALRLTGVENISIIGLALSYTITAITESCLLFYFFRKQFPQISSVPLLESLNKTAFASLAMVVATLSVRHILGLALNLQSFWGIFFQLFISGGVALSSYAVASYLLRSDEFAVIIRAFGKKLIAAEAPK